MADEIRTTRETEQQLLGVVFALGGFPRVPPHDEPAACREAWLRGYDEAKTTPAPEIGPDGHEWVKTEAGYAFVETMVPRADDPRNLMWFGWALREAFVAGAEWQEKRTAKAPQLAATGLIMQR